MNVVFYAPLKAPDHATPSGDRTMARNLVDALQHGGHTVTVPSDLRLYEGAGDVTRQDALMVEARGEVTRLTRLRQAREWQAWVTYHNYYKAPDLVGPAICAALNIPYIQVESTRARKRLTGPWAQFAAAAEAASNAAKTIFYVTHRDAETLERDAPKGQRLVHLPPFLARTDLPAQSTLDGPMLSVAMMRPGDKLASYHLVAQTLAALPDPLDWHLDIAGDGAAAPEVAQLMAPFGERVRMLGRLNASDLAAHYGQSSLLFWPGVNEAFGLVYLEAQAAGVPVIAQDRPGVCDVVVGQQSPISAGPTDMAKRITRLLRNDAARADAGAKARARIQESHLLGPAAATLTSALSALV